MGFGKTFTEKETTEPKESKLYPNYLDNDKDLITKLYRGAESKSDQIRILSELFGCTPDAMKCYLLSCGYDDRYTNSYKIKKKK